MRPVVALAAALMLASAACGGDDDGRAGTSPDALADRTSERGAANAPGAAQGRGGGTLTFGAETIAMERVGCHLKEQPRAGLGGTFEFSIQANGTNGAGKRVVLDITRNRPDPDGDRFGRIEQPSDHVTVDVGDPRSDDHVSYTGRGDIGTVVLDGSALSTPGITVKPLVGLAEGVQVRFDLTCT